MVILLIAYLALSWATGFALTYVTRMPWELEGRLAAGVPLGFAASALLTWVIAIPIGMSALPVFLGAPAMIAVIWACARWTHLREAFRREANEALFRWRHLQMRPLVALLVLASAFFIAFYSHALSIEADGLHVGHTNIFGDWTTHLSLTGYLATAQHLLPPENPFYAGTHITYSFLTDFHSGLLTHLGLGLLDTLPFTSVVLSIALVGVFYSTALRFTKERWAAFMATLILFIGGGLAFTGILDDITPTGDGAGGWLGGALKFLASPPHDYTWIPDLGVWWRTPFVAFMMPQRTVLFGWSLGLIALSILWHGWSTRSRREMVIAGALIGLLPLFHVATYISLAVITAGLFLLSWRRFRDWVAFALPAVLLGAPQVLMILPPAEQRHGFGGFQLGWMASTTGHNDNIFWFWFVNTAFLIPLALLVFVIPRWSPPNLRRFMLPIWLLFLIPNIYVLAPWDFDNTKFLMWWAMPAAMLAGLALLRIGRKGPLLAGLAVVLLLTQVISGAVDLDRAVQPRLQAYQYLDNDELALASWARSQTPLDSVFLTAWNANQPILTLSQRVEVMGFPTWLWSWDIDYRPRQQDVISMFHGGAGTDQLLQRYNVRYVVIGPHEIKETGANVSYYSSRYHVVYSSPQREYQVYQVG